jgi:hypothetical protein
MSLTIKKKYITWHRDDVSVKRPSSETDRRIDKPTTGLENRGSTVVPRGNEKDESNPDEHYKVRTPLLPALPGP